LKCFERTEIEALNMHRWRPLLRLLILCLGVCLVAVRAQEAWPNKPIKIVVPVAAGGTVDVVARMLAQELSKSLGQSVMVENRPSAASLVGTVAVAKAPPDGYTLLAHSSTFLTAPLVVDHAGYDPVRDFAPISMTCKSPMVLVAGPAQAFQTLKDLVQAAKAKPGEISVASSGNGSTGHMASEVFAARAGTRMLNVFYKGNAQAMTDVMGGQAQVMFDQIGTAMGPIKSRKLLPLAVTGAQRSALMPEVPTIAESGYAGYEDVTLNMLLAPRGTPQEILNRLHLEITKIYGQPDLISRFAARGIELVASPSPQAFAQTVKAEVERLRKVTLDAGIQPE
jgi:tripartite-type tricarboxylate transporter receptor subunit TctC